MVQGSSADMIKIAMINMRRWINTENLRDVVQMFVQVHDEINLNSRDDYAELTAQKLTEFMEKAAEIVLNNTLLKAESEITKKW